MTISALFTFDQFFAFIRPGLEMAVALLNWPIFKSSLGLDIGLWHILLGLFIFSFVIGFIIKGNGFNGSFIPHSNRGEPRDGISSSVTSGSHSDDIITYDQEG